MSALSAFFVAAAVAFLVAALVRRGALRRKLVVPPRPDRWHRQPTPSFGGIGVIAGLIAGAWIAGGLSVATAPILASGAALFVVGLYDDWDPLSAVAKMVMSLAVASFFVIALTGFVATPLEASLAILAIIVFGGLDNAFNLLDNMDGLAGGVSAVAALGLAATFATELGPGPIMVLDALSGALCGFLFWNRHPARIFMGNCGSLAVGGIIAACATLAVARAHSLTALASALLIMTVPIFDTAFVVVLRRLAGRSTTAGNIDHTSHRLVVAGFSEPAAVISLTVLGVAGTVTGYMLRHGASSAAPIAAIFAIGVLMLALALGRVPAYGDGEDFRALQRSPFAPLLNDLTFRWHAGEVLLDLVLITVCYYAAYRVRFEGVALATFLASFSRSLPAIVGCQLAALYFSGLYARMWSTFGLHDVSTVLRAVILGCVLSVLAVTYLFKFEAFSRSVFIIDAVLLFVAIVATRLSQRMFGRMAARSNPDRRRVLIYGAGTRGQLLAREFAATESWQRLAVAFVDDDTWKQGRRFVGVAVLGGVREVEGLLRELAIDELVISTPEVDASRETYLRGICQPRGASVTRLTLDIQ